MVTEQAILNHDHISRTLDLTTVQGIPVIVSPFYDNGNVMEYVFRNPDTDKGCIVNTIDSILIDLTLMPCLDYRCGARFSLSAPHGNETREYMQGEPR
jgi:hypothetical protein